MDSYMFVSPSRQTTLRKISLRTNFKERGIPEDLIPVPKDPAADFFYCESEGQSGAVICYENPATVNKTHYLILVGYMIFL